MSNALEIENLVKDYGSLRAVDSVSFHVREGEIFGLLGPNGAGKTSIISIIVTLEKATSGNAKVFGHNVATEPQKTKPMIGYVPQELIHHGYFDVDEIMQFHAGFYGRLHNRERNNYLLERMGLWAHRHKKVKQLSGGMKRRLLIAKALVHEPKLLILDEPTAGVDIELRSSLWEFVRELKASGMSILLTTHYLEEAEELCDRVGIIQKGKICAEGETQKLVRELTQRKLCLQLKGEKPIEHWLPKEVNIGEFIAKLGIEITKLEDIKVTEGSLEEAVMRVLGDHK